MPTREREQDRQKDGQRQNHGQEFDHVKPQQGGNGVVWNKPFGDRAHQKASTLRNDDAEQNQKDTAGCANQL